LVKLICAYESSKVDVPIDSLPYNGFYGNGLGRGTGKMRVRSRPVALEFGTDGGSDAIEPDNSLRDPRLSVKAFDYLRMKARWLKAGWLKAGQLKLRTIDSSRLQVGGGDTSGDPKRHHLRNARDATLRAALPTEGEKPFTLIVGPCFYVRPIRKSRALWSNPT
jgi:hypothetical protein